MYYILKNYFYFYLKTSKKLDLQIFEMCKIIPIQMFLLTNDNHCYIVIIARNKKKLRFIFIL